MASRLCSVSIDIDTLSCYAQIHGLASDASMGPLPHNAPADPVYTLALPRFLALFERYGIRATLFVIGRDAEHPEHAAILREAAARGHELANHSYHHSYRLTQMSDAAIAQEIARGTEAIAPLLPEGQRVEGFRCPGYNVSAAVLQALREQGYRYDSSVFPCPPYVLAKAAILGLLWLRGRPSHSMLGSPQVLWAPNRPYQPGDNPHRPAARPEADGLWELPMSVLPGLRLPLIGTSVMLYPRWLLPSLTRTMARTHAFLNFEWHGIDLMDPLDPHTKPLVPHQPDLKIPLVEKQERAHAVLGRLAETHRFVTLSEAVASFASGSS